MWFSNEWIMRVKLERIIEDKVLEGGLSRYQKHEAVSLNSHP